jgi:Tfp pilus assembly protein PilF
MASADSTTERRSRREASLVMLAGALLVLAPVVVSEAPRERARWHFAAALEYEQAGNTQAALESLEQAIELDPFQPHFYMTRGGRPSRSLRTTA